MSKKLALLLIGVYAGAFSSCSHPVSPPPSSVASSYHVTITSAKSGLVSYPFFFSAHIDFDSSVIYKWSFDSSSFVIQRDSTINRTFNTVGQHIIRVAVLRSADSAQLCSAVDTFTSLPYILTITPDSLRANPATTYIFTANLNPLRTYSKYKLVWTIDNVQTVRSNTDTISWGFSQLGVHHINVVQKDSTGAPQDSASTVVIIAGFPMHLSAVPDSAAINSPINFILSHSTSFPSGSSLAWDFGDGFAFDTVAETVTHSFGFSGNMKVKVSLHTGGTIIGQDSTLIDIPPTLQGYNPVLLDSFHRLVITFVGDNQYSPLTVGGMVNCAIGGNIFEQSIPVDIQNGIATGVGLMAKFANNALQCDTACCSIGASGIVTDACPSPPGGVHSAVWSWNQTLSISNLSLQFFTPDSIRYRILGPLSSAHVNFTSSCLTQLIDCYGGSFDEEGKYIGTNWNGSPIPWATVTLYK